MNIMDFITSNMPWIIAVVVITIITIVGFLADRKRSQGPKKSLTDTNNNPGPTVPVYENSGIQMAPIGVSPAPLNNPEMGANPNNGSTPQPAMNPGMDLPGQSMPGTGAPQMVAPVQPIPEVVNVIPGANPGPMPVVNEMPQGSESPVSVVPTPMPAEPINNVGPVPMPATPNNGGVVPTLVAPELNGGVNPIPNPVSQANVIPPINQGPIQAPPVNGPVAPAINQGTIPQAVNQMPPQNNQSPVSFVYGPQQNNGGMPQ